MPSWWILQHAQIYFPHGQCNSHVDSVIVEVYKEAKTVTKYIGTGMMPLYQFIDTHINKQFKDDLRYQWEQWLDNVKQEYTKSGNRKRAS